jgi:glycerophosphoryl diester phosphodiesterase
MPAFQSLIGHRGAPALAPEHTLASYDLAVRMGAGAVEQDLQVTSDGVLVCVHDFTLERTTNVCEVFPNRGRKVATPPGTTTEWRVHDFTLAEIKTLDAGTWFDPAFAGQRILTLQEVIDAVIPRAGLCTELKDEPAYASLGVDVLALAADILRRNGLTSSPLVTLQSFHAPTVRRATASGVTGEIPWVWLVDAHDGHLLETADRVAGVAAFAQGLGPHKSILEKQPGVVGWAHAAGLRVTPWAFRASDPSPLGTLRQEMAHHLDVLGVDAVITDNPHECPGVVTG